MNISKIRPEVTMKYIVTSAEGQFYDRKSGRITEKELARHISAFSNANGGIIALGVEDDGKITGFNDLGDNKFNELLKVPANFFLPQPDYEIEIIEIENNKLEKDKIILLHILASNDRLVKLTDGKTYLRIGDSSKELSTDEIIKIELDKGIRRAEDEIIEDATMEDIDLETVNEFKRRLEIISTTEEILKNRGLMKEKNGQRLFTKAGILLFGNNPSKFFPNARVRFVRYDGIYSATGERLNIIKDISIEGSLNKIIEKVKLILSAQLRDFNSLDINTGKFKTIPEYPEFAWLEGIVNAIVHRDYFLMGEHIKVLMYDDRLEILSPGKLPNYVTIENMKNNRFSRNPKIARVMNDFGWVKEMNEGVKRIYEEMSNYFLEEPSFSEPNDNSVLLVLKNNIVMRRLRRDQTLSQNWAKIWDGLSEYERKAITLAYINGRLTSSQLAKYIGRTTVSSRKVIKELCQKGILTWYGTSQNDSKQYYQISKSYE